LHLVETDPYDYRRFLRRVEGGLGCRRIQLGLLDLLRNPCIHRDRIVRIGLFEIALACLRLCGEVLVFQNCEQLAFFYARTALHSEFRDRRGDFWRDGRLFQRKHDGFRGHELRNSLSFGRLRLYGHDRLFLFFSGAATGERRERRERKQQSAPDFHGVVSSPVSV
jgi:hypothetical protein